MIFFAKFRIFRDTSGGILITKRLNTRGFIHLIILISLRKNAFVNFLTRWNYLSFQFRKNVLFSIIKKFSSGIASFVRTVQMTIFLAFSFQKCKKITFWSKRTKVYLLIFQYAKKCKPPSRQKFKWVANKIRPVRCSFLVSFTTRIIIFEKSETAHYISLNLIFWYYAEHQL